MARTHFGWTLIALSGLALVGGACNPEKRNFVQGDGDGDTGGGNIDDSGSGGNEIQGSGGNTSNSGGNENQGSGGRGLAGENGNSGGDAGNSGGDTGSSGGSGGDTNLPMHCEEGEPDCSCDAQTGCFIDEGGTCVSSSGCESQYCGVAQDNSNICCAELCDEGDVCLPDGSGCEAELSCEEADERCADGGSSFQRCDSGQWETSEDCGNLGCNLAFGGCLGSLGDSCAGDDECGEGQCQETPDGSSVCCSLSCGSCQVCNTAADSCVDPAEVKSGCSCTENDLSNCEDGLSCTQDSCDDGQCANDLDSGYCVIDGQCVDHNEAESGNPCRYCDVNIRTQGWTNSSNTVSCDDGAWCTGEDTCNGSGQCEHDYPTANRCNQVGECALGSCSEERDSCFKPSTDTCDSASEYRCASSTCGADVQSRTLTSYCSGTSAACDGAVVQGAYTTSTACSAQQLCSDSGSATPTCQNSLGCVADWCDPSSGLCWAPAAAARPWNDAIAYCDGLSLGGRTDWRLPTVVELIDTFRGCVNGSIVGDSVKSSCVVPDVTQNSVNNCDTCTPSAGPNNGCFAAAEMDLDCVGLTWLSLSSSDMGPFGPWMVNVAYGGVSNSAGTGQSNGVACVVEE